MGSHSAGFQAGYKMMLVWWLNWARIVYAVCLACLDEGEIASDAV